MKKLAKKKLQYIKQKIQESNGNGNWFSLNVRRIDIVHHPRDSQSHHWFKISAIPKQNEKLISKHLELIKFKNLSTF